MDPFNQSGGGQKDEPQSGGAGLQQQQPAGVGAGGPDRPSSLTDTTHPTEKGAREQAAATAPEGTEKAHRQQTQGNTDKVSYIG